MTFRKFLSAVFLTCATGLPAFGDALYDAFREPAPDHRPFVRWWWNGGRVEARELVRELDAFKAAGLGGFEINTIGMPDGASAASLAKYPAKSWLSPAWNECVRLTAEAARARNLTADLIVGSGWPFGGQFLQPEEQTQRVLLTKRTLRGPGRVRLTREELLRPDPPAKNRQEPEPDPTRSELVFLRLVAAAGRQGDFSPGTDLRPALSPDGTITLEVPAGDQVLYAGIRQLGFTHVKLGAPGADGPVVNHFDAAAVRKYLDHMSEKLAPTLGGNLGPALRALFVDSIELDHANWTGDLPAEFQRRRGYDLSPYLPFVLEPDAPEAAGSFNDTIRRARYDFDQTLLELFRERFLVTFRQWAQDNRVKARIQAYGRETHPLEGSMEAELPEGETWLWIDQARPDRIRVESTVANKYVSSAANLTGQPLRSFEAMTNAVPVFRETLQDFKRGLDASFVAGLNQPIFHGFNYTPPDAGFPGWVRFGCYLNERTPWWPYFHQVTDYAARVGTVLRSSVAKARVAVLAPRPDEWSRHGLLYQPFPEVADPWYQFHLIDAVQQAGFNADYISEKILTEGTKQDGQLRFGPCAYDLLILLEVESMEPAAVRALADFVAHGGRVVFVGAAPSRAPGLRDATANDALVRSTTAALGQTAGERVRLMPAPIHPTPASAATDEQVLLDFSTHLLAGTGLVPDIRFDRPRVQVSQISLRAGDRALYFIANRDADAPARIRAAFPGAKGRAYRWDPLTGERHSLALNQKSELALDLAPVESALIAFEPGEPALLAPEAEAGQAKELLTLAGPWKLQLTPAASKLITERQLPVLVDFSRPEQADELRYFGGAATYEIEFDGTGLGDAVLDLGVVHSTSEVFLNGQLLGSRCWGLHHYSLAGFVRPGRNVLQIKVTTVLANMMQHKSNDATAQRWASWAPPIPAGLIGPVRLISARKIPAR